MYKNRTISLKNKHTLKIGEFKFRCAIGNLLQQGDKNFITLLVYNYPDKVSLPDISNSVKFWNAMYMVMTSNKLLKWKNYHENSTEVENMTFYSINYNSDCRGSCIFLTLLTTIIPLWCIALKKKIF